MSTAAQFLAELPTGLSSNLSSAQVSCQVAGHIAGLTGATGTVPLFGINGAQGSGKSTLTQLVAHALQQFHQLRAVVLSLDDFYLGKAARQALAGQVHPLCATRGVPGTHDVALLRATLAALRGADDGAVTAIPVFDKLADDRAQASAWVTFAGRPDVILFEGWCVGLQSAVLPAWQGPINALEAECDPQGIWAGWSRAALVQDYDALWAEIDLLVSIEVASLEEVVRSRLRQEQGLAIASGRTGMDRAAVERFVQHYERHTRALWAAMPAGADILLRRDTGYGFEIVKEGSR
ncbi:MAG: hypothetical protein RIS94_1698 [Pseudomonadota bacterium]|jgi:D-glycerate 3-kinase